jgi:hypothetical protein
MLLRSRLVASGCTVLMLAALTSCSSASDEFGEQSADEIAAAARSAMGELDAMRLDGILDSGGTPIDLDLTISTDGDCAGTLGLEDGTAELLGVDGEVWFRPDRNFWLITAGTEDLADQLLAVTGDRWVALPDDDTTYVELCDLDSFLEGLFDQSEATYSKGEEQQVDGQDAIGVVSERADRAASTGFVSVEEPHLLLLIERGGDVPTEIAFTDFDVRPEVEAPGADEQIELTDLQSSVI